MFVTNGGVTTDEGAGAHFHKGRFPCVLAMLAFLWILVTVGSGVANSKITGPPMDRLLKLSGQSWLDYTLKESVSLKICCSQQKWRGCCKKKSLPGSALRIY